MTANLLQIVFSILKSLAILKRYWFTISNETFHVKFEITMSEYKLIANCNPNKVQKHLLRCSLYIESHCIFQNAYNLRMKLFLLLFMEYKNRNPSTQMLHQTIKIWNPIFRPVRSTRVLWSHYYVCIRSNSNLWFPCGQVTTRCQISNTMPVWPWTG